jgi:thiamine pyrophosphokinase
VTSWVEIANCLGLAPSSLSIIMLNKNKIIKGEMKCGTHSNKRMNIKIGACEGLEKILYEQFQQMHSESVPRSQKATDVALCLKIVDLRAPN